MANAGAQHDANRIQALSSIILTTAAHLFAPPSQSFCLGSGGAKETSRRFQPFPQPHRRMGLFVESFWNACTGFKQIPLQFQNALTKSIYKIFKSAWNQRLLCTSWNRLAVPGCRQRGLERLEMPKAISGWWLTYCTEYEKVN